MSSTPTPVIVADSGPLISLGRIHRLDLLRQLYGEILVPPAVWHEVTVANALAPGAEAAGFVDHLRPILSELQQAGFFLNPAIGEQVLRSIGE